MQVPESHLSHLFGGNLNYGEIMVWIVIMDQYDKKGTQNWSENLPKRPQSNK